MNTVQHIAYVGAGSNMSSGRGSPDTIVMQAQTELAALFGDAVGGIRASALYWTEPQLVKDQPWYANTVLELSFVQPITPLDCLMRLLELEHTMGRVRTVHGAAGDMTAGQRYGPRVIDLDLLLFDDACCSSETLSLPHPRMTERAFVLLPLAELAPDRILPQTGHTVREHLEQLTFRLDGDRIFQA